MKPSITEWFCMAEAWSAVPEWVRKAEADWIAATTLHSQNEEALHDAVVFHAQQCVEKLLKARLIQLDQPIQKVHDLVAVSRQLANVDSDWQWDEEDLSDLSTGAVLARYPGFETTADDAAELMGLAGKIRMALLSLLNPSA
ncbi:MAG: HEPN domain-containing protein [Prochlorococcaceae cyanobacterium]